MPRTGHFATGGSVATETVETDQKPSPHKANKKALRASIPQHLKPEELFGRIASEDEVITWKDLRRGVRLQLRIGQDAMDDEDDYYDEMEDAEVAAENSKAAWERKAIMYVKNGKLAELEEALDEDVAVDTAGIMACAIPLLHLVLMLSLDCASVLVIPAALTMSHRTCSAHHQNMTNNKFKPPLNKSFIGVTEILSALSNPSVIIFILKFSRWSSIRIFLCLKPYIFISRSMSMTS